MAAAEASVLRVHRVDGGSVGVGVLIGSRTATTCAHVVNAALGRAAREEPAPGDVIVEADFPLLGAVSVQAAVTGWAPPPPAGDDIAMLTLPTDAPKGARPARFHGEHPTPGTAVQMFGLPALRPAGVWSTATVRGRVAGGRLQLDGDPDSAWRAQPGFSGGPVFEVGSGLVVGLLAETASVRAGERDGYAIPVDRIAALAPGLMSTPGRSELDVGDVRRLIDHALSTEDIDDLALDHFPEVYRDFVAGTGRRARIRQLVEYASRRDRLDELVALVREVNPAAKDARG
jgi:hypothetical protein